jgi:carboxymethylenebutenolidase
MWWNSFQTDDPEGLTAQVITYASGGDQINAYVVRPAGDEPRPGIVAVHHLPGWDEFHREFSDRLARHGYTVICPNLYFRFGQGTPDDVAARARAEGGVSDDRVVGDCAAALAWLKALPTSNGKVGVIGMCSGGRHALLAASRTPGYDAVADLWGGGVTGGQTSPAQPVPVIDYTADLTAPLLGLFGNDDRYPTPEQVDLHVAELQRHGKAYEFYRYDGATHGIFYYHTPMYRPEQAMDGWEKVFGFFSRHLSG